jgi:hypothetical protein
VIFGVALRFFNFELVHGEFLRKANNSAQRR